MVGGKVQPRCPEKFPAALKKNYPPLNPLGLDDKEHSADTLQVGPQAYRAMREAGKTVFPAYTLLPEAGEIDIPSRETGRSIPCRLIKPKSTNSRPGIFLHIHGGGWVLGTAKG